MTHINVNDQSIEGIKHKVYPAFSFSFNLNQLKFIAGELVFELFLEIMDNQLGEEKTYATL